MNSPAGSGSMDCTNCLHFQPTPTALRLHGEVVGLLGPANGEGWRRLLPDLQALMQRCPHVGRSLSSQQLGNAAAAVPIEATSFVHRDATWKPWITAVWSAGDLEGRRRSLQWLNELWSCWSRSAPVCIWRS